MNFYTSIDELPIYNWFKCIDKKEYTYVVKLGNATDDECKEQFSKLYEEYIDTFGISQQLQGIIEKQNEILVLKIDKVLTEDRTLQFFIDMKELELKDLMEVKQTGINKNKVLIEKYLGFRLNEKEVTVKEYYEYLEALKENGRSTD